MPSPAKTGETVEEAALRIGEGRVISLRGAREHNLKNVDLTIPRDKLVVFTGLSGSGKSSLAFDTIYAEGQRRYVESLSAYARQFLRNDAEAGRGPYRGPVAGHFDRAEDHVEKSALDRRHGDGNQRLHAPAVGAGRHSLFAGHRPADREPDGQPDGGPRARPARAHQGFICWLRWCAAARANIARKSPNT